MALTSHSALDRYPELPSVLRRLSRQNKCFNEVLAILHEQGYEIGDKSLRNTIRRLGVILRRATERPRQATAGCVQPSAAALRMARRQAALYVDEQIEAHHADLKSARPPSPLGRGTNLVW